MDESKAGQWNRKHIRLDHELYAIPDMICSVTIGLAERRPLFANDTLARTAVGVLEEHAYNTGAQVFGYCFMPDHVHLVLGPSATCDLITFVGQYKNLAQRALWEKGHTGIVWQQRFWDHFLRSDEHLERVVEYVLNNPVRKELVTRWQEYPYSGSLELSLPGR